MPVLYTMSYFALFTPFLFFPPYGILKKPAQTAQTNNHAGLRLVCTPHKRAFQCTNLDFKGKEKKRPSESGFQTACAGAAG
ncbi:MAG: hypothetical protein D8H97_41650 [Neisseria sp.]|nr:MAG: hypothetical protein D8H97_41650 [Neisseria sp.]